MDKLEKFYRAPNGEIVFNALASVGAEQSFSCRHLHGYADNSFPSAQPAQSIEENIWATFTGMLRSE